MQRACSISLTVAFALAMCWPAAVSAQRATRTVVLGSAGDAMAIAERALMSGEAATAEKLFRALLNDPSPEVRAEARFRIAKLIAANGRTSEAAVLLRRVLDDHPNAAPVRLELAALLSKLGDEAGALRELRAVRTTDLPLQVARFVDRLSASLQANKPLGFQLELALAPDTNINRATRSDTLGTVIGDFAINERVKSGVGATVRGLVQARLRLASDLDFAGRISSDASLYRDKDFDDVTLDMGAGPELRLGHTRLTAEAGATQQWYGMNSFQRTLRVAGSAVQQVDAVSQLRLDAVARWADNRFNDLQDGRGLSLRARYERALSPRLLVVGTVGRDRFRARDEGYSTTTWTAGITAYRDIGRMTMSASAETSRLRADERLSLFPSAREDKLTRISFGSVFRQFTVAGFAPVTRLVFERNRSSVEFYDYRRTRTEFGISRAF